MQSIPSLFHSTSRAAVFPRVFSTLRARTWLLALCGVLGVMLCGAWSASSAQTATATSTVMTVTSGGTIVTTVSTGSVVTLTATVTAGTAPVTPGLVKFCDAAAAFCEDIHIVGSGQLTTAGTAVVKLRPVTGNRSYKAVFVGTKSYAGSASSAAGLAVTGSLHPSITTIAQSGIAGSYTLTATVTGQGLLFPTGTVSFLDTSNANVLLRTASLANAENAVSWLNSQSPATGEGPAQVAVGDFNGDGMPDLAVVNETEGNGSVTILLGNGDGTFVASTVNSTLFTDPGGVAVGDFNGDGKMDLAVVNPLGSEVTILLGNGDGTFNSTSNLVVGSIPESVAVGDFNGDGIPDLAVANRYSDTLSILLGNGDGTFTSAASPATGFYPGSVVVGDFNGDGFQDLAAANLLDDTVTILLGNGDGTFTAIASPATGYRPMNIAVGDFNGDGKPDLAVAYQYSGSITILLGKGDGTFTPLTGPTASGEFITVGDFNGDGKADLATSSESNGINVLLGNGDGTFSQATSLTAGGYSASIVAADFNGDGLSDLASADDTGNTADVLISQLTSTATINDISILGHGIHAVDASYPGDTNFSSSVSSTTALTAVPSIPTINWATPAPIIFGAPLSATQLDATSPVAGTFTYSPAAGTVLTGGPQTLTATFTPTDTLDYSTATATVTLTVSPATPTITWATPAPITYGTTLGAAQLDATASAAGTFSYSTVVGTVLGVGSHTITATFTPTDSADYTGASSSVTLVVNQATPAITWLTPAAITYGTTLGAAQLDASSSVAGTFSYSLAAGTVLGAGSHTITATFTPTDTTDYTGASSSVTLVVNQATPAITWPTPAAITYGTALGATQLDASSPVAGAIAYSPASGTMLSAGQQTLKATFTPTDTTDYTTATATVTLTVNQATPTITWSTPASIIYGAGLGSAQLDATSSVAGSFAYSPALGTVLGAGSQTLTATFTPTDTTDYKNATATTTLTVIQATPTISWATLAPISYGTALGTAQLNASSTVAGTFSYSSTAGTVLGAGPHTITATFTPTDSTDYTKASSSVTLVVTQATPAILWPAPAAITYGAALGGAQLDATSPVAGTFVYSPAASTVLSAGPQTLKATFTPTDTADYTTASATVTLSVNQATPTITWPTPAAITYGAGLGSAQLDATSSVAGSFAYSPAPGTVLGAGPQTLTVTFTPTDTADYTAATKAVTLTVNQATPTINWPTPAAITSGTALTATQLNATATVPGTFVYSPALGATPPVGNDTLSVIFTPTDNVDYATATASVTLTVNVPLNPLPFLGNITPAIADAGGAAFTITVNGSGFLPSSIVYWGTSALTTQFVSSTQLTATVTAADIAIPGATAVNVQTPAPGGGTSDVLQFEVDSASGSATAPTVPSTVVTVTAGTTATYSISFPASVTNATATCLNLPAGAICSYSFTTGALTISTSSATPAGTYQVTVVFTETVASTSSALLVFPFLLLPLFFLRKKLTSRGIWPAVGLSLILLAATAFSVGCGGSSSSTKTATTQAVTSSGVVGMTVH
jgi:hypothetical protein